MLACGEPSPKTLGPADTDTDGAYEGTGGYFPDDGADGTVEGGLGPYYNGCKPFPIPGSDPGVRHQCSGSMNVRVAFDAVNIPWPFAAQNGPKSFTSFLEFGQGKVDDSYDKPKVMACCYPIEDIEVPFGNLEPHLTFCYHDLVETGCRSLVSRLLSLKDLEETPFAANEQIDQLAEWIADNQQACYDAYWTNSVNYMVFPDAWFPGSILPEAFADVTWQLPASAETLNVKNIALTMELPWITSVWLPDDPADWLECDSQQDVDVEFLDAEPGGGGLLPLTQGAVSLLGPVQPRYPAPTGTADLASTTTACELCSYFSFDTAAKTLDALVLDTADVATYGQSIRVDDFRVALYRQVDVVKIGSGTWRVAAGAAMFSVTASSAGANWSLTGRNRDAFEVSYVQSIDTWVVEEFDIDYKDANSDTWLLTVEELSFETL